MRVLVIGGGIGGMATSIALEQAGLDPYVLEQAPELTEIGSGIGMHANAMRVLTQLGAAEHVRRSGVRIDTGEWRRMDDGRRCSRSTTRAWPSTTASSTSACTAPTSSRAWSSASRTERGPAERQGRRRRGAARRRRSRGWRTATRSSATSWSAPTVCARRSARMLFGEQEARFTGVAAWRGTIPIGADAARASGTRSSPGRPWPPRDDLSDPRRPLRPSTRSCPPTEIHQEEWGRRATSRTCGRSFDGARAPCSGSSTASPRSLITPIYFRDPLPVWGTDRVVLLGTPRIRHRPARARERPGPRGRA